MSNGLRDKKSDPKEKDAQRMAFGLSQFQPGTIITEKEFAMAIGKAHNTVRRAVEHGELPESVYIGQVAVWTQNTLAKHLEERLQSIKNGMSCKGWMIPRPIRGDLTKEDIKIYADQVESLDDLLEFILTLRTNLKINWKEHSTMKPMMYFDNAAKWLRKHRKELGDSPTWKTVAYVIANARHGAQATAWGLLRNGMTQADPFSAASELEALRTQLETHYEVTSRLSALHLTRFLR